MGHFSRANLCRVGIFGMVPKRSASRHPIGSPCLLYKIAEKYSTVMTGRRRNNIGPSMKYGSFAPCSSKLDRCLNSQWNRHKLRERKETNCWLRTLMCLLRFGSRDWRPRANIWFSANNLNHKICRAPFSLEYSLIASLYLLNICSGGKKKKELGNYSRFLVLDRLQVLFFGQDYLFIPQESTKHRSRCLCSPSPAPPQNENAHTPLFSSPKFLLNKSA